MGKHIDISEYSKLKNMAKRHFEEVKTGEQSLLEETTRFFKPVMDSSKQLNQKLLSNQQQLTNTLVPLTNRLEQRIDQVENLQSLPYYYTPEIEAVLHSTPEKVEAIGLPQKGVVFDVNPDINLNETDKENLQDMYLELPSAVLSKNSYEHTLESIKTNNRQNGQFLGAASKKTDKEKQIYISRSETLKKYKASIEDLQKSQKYVKKSGEGVKQKGLVKQKRGRGRPRTKPDLIVYNSAGELVNKLNEYTQAYRAGNNGVHNYIVSILDELLHTNTIDKEAYDNLFKNIILNTYK